MAWWEWLLLLWVGGTAGLAGLLALVVFGQDVVGRLVRRGSGEAETDELSIDLRDQPTMLASRNREAEVAPEPCN